MFGLFNRKDETQTIVIADDEPKFVSDFTSAAEAAGFKVITYPSAGAFIEGLRKGQEPRPYLFVFDIQMEDEQAGFRALETLKKTPEHKGSAIIMVSKSVRHSDVCSSYERGASLFIRKSLNARTNRKSLAE